MQRREVNQFVLFSLILVIFFFLPVESIWFKDLFFGPGWLNNSLIEALGLLNNYAQKHFFTSILPAMFIAGGIVTFVRREAVLKYLGYGAKKVVSYPIASVAGGFLTVCSCTILPLFAGIKRRGSGLGPATTFLFSGPAINIAAIFLTMSVLGLEIGMARVSLAILLSVLVGLSMALIFREKSEKKELFMQQSNVPEVSSHALIILFGLLLFFIGINFILLGVLGRLILMAIVLVSLVFLIWMKFPGSAVKKWFDETWSFSKSLFPVLFLGIFIVGFIMPMLPPEMIESYVGENTILANFIASIFGAFMYFSTLTEIPILEGLMNHGMNKGPALALLLGGPSVSIPNMLVIRKVLGNKKTAVYIFLVVLYSTIAGFIFGML